MPFTVLMSIYKGENADNFKQALGSNMINQTMLPNEMVLVCDGPLTEEIEKVISEFTNKFPNILKVYRKEKNEGLGLALQYGMLKCSNEIIARSDTDDICCPSRFEKEYNYLIDHRNIDIVGSCVDEFEEDYYKPYGVKNVPLSHEKIYEYAKFRNPMCHMTVMFRKQSALKAGSYKPVFYLEDYYLWIRMLINGATFANINEILVHVRAGKDRLYRRGNKNYIDGWKMIDRCMLKHGMINKVDYVKNMCALYGFIYMPVGLKKIVYKTFLRK